VTDEGKKWGLPTDEELEEWLGGARGRSKRSWSCRRSTIQALTTITLGDATCSGRWAVAADWARDGAGGVTDARHVLYWHLRKIRGGDAGSRVR
jgi:hypothetical protein